MRNRANMSGYNKIMNNKRTSKILRYLEGEGKALLCYAMIWRIKLAYNSLQNCLRLTEMDQQKLKILLDSSIEWDGTKASYLDQVTASTSCSDPVKINLSNSVLQTLYSDPVFWMHIDKIFSFCTNPRSKFYGFVILQNAIKIKWKSLNNDQKEGVKNFVGHIVMTLSEQDNLDAGSEDILKKCNSCLVEILKYEWNTTWTNFIDQVCQSSQKSMNVCQNNFHILKLLSEEIFDFSKNQMTAQQISSLKEQMNSQFTNVFNLCELVLNNESQLKPQLVKTCLDTLHSFLSWIPIYYIYFSDVINKLTLFASKDYYRASALNCLIEIANIPVDINSEKAAQIQLKLFESFMSCLEIFNNILILSEDIPAHRRGRYRSNLYNFDITCKAIALFISNFLREQGHWLLKTDEQRVVDGIKISFKFMLLLLTSTDEQIFKIVIEFFHHFLKVTLGFGDIQSGSVGIQLTVPNMFKEFFSELRQIVVVKMAKPQEVLIVIDETGTPIREDLANTENSSFYETMIEVLIYMMKIDWFGLKNLIINRIQTQLDGGQFRYDIVNSLSWAVGALSGHLPDNEERGFLIAILKMLLKLCDSKKAKEDKAVLASCIMFVVGQYPGFLRANWTFLKTVIKKLYEFMSQTYEGVMEMACNTFLKICKSTQEVILQQHPDDKQPYIYTLIRQIPEKVKGLQSVELIMLFYEAIAHVIAKETAQSVKIIYMKETLGSLLQQFSTIVARAGQNPAVIQEENIQRSIQYFIRINEILARVIGLPYGALLAEFNSFLNIMYQYYGGILNDQVAQNGPNVINYVSNKRMRTINKQILRLYRTYITNCNNLELNEMNSIKETFIISLSEAVNLFSKSIPDLKEPEFITLFTVVFEKLHPVLTPEFVSVVIETIFGSALGMITNDFSSYPEIRQSFFEFVRAMIKYNFEQFYNMPGDKFETTLNCVVWSFKHHLSTFSDLGLELLEAIFNSMNSNKAIANAFYQKYYINLLKDLLQVLTDGYHKSGMKLQSRLLFILIQAVTSNYFAQRLTEGQTVSNTEYVYQFLLNILTDTFSNVGKNDTSQILTALFQTSDEKQFRTILRDYLVMINRLSNIEGQEIAQ